MVLNLAILFISFLLAYFLGWKLRLLIRRKNKFISLVCSVVVLFVFFITQENLFAMYTDRSFHAIVYGLAFGLASGLGNSSKKDNNKAYLEE